MRSTKRAIPARYGSGPCLSWYLDVVVKKPHVSGRTGGDRIGLEHHAHVECFCST